MVPVLALLSAQTEGEEQVQVPPHQIASGNLDLDLVMLNKGFPCSWMGWVCRTLWSRLTPCPLDEGWVTITLSFTSSSCLNC